MLLGGGPVESVPALPFNPFSAAVPIRGQTALIPSDLPPKRDRSPTRKRVKYVFPGLDLYRLCGSCTTSHNGR